MTRRCALCALGALGLTACADEGGIPQKYLGGAGGAGADGGRDARGSGGAGGARGDGDGGARDADGARPETGTPEDAGGDAVTGDTADSAAGGCATAHGMDVGAVTDFKPGTWTLVSPKSGKYFVVGHDGKGLFAYNGRCTHSSCPIGDPDSRGVSLCPCHGSMYDGNGDVLMGPAVDSLPHYAVEICEAHAYVDSSKSVPPETRTKV